MSERRDYTERSTLVIASEAKQSSQKEFCSTRLLLMISIFTKKLSQENQR